MSGIDLDSMGRWLLETLSKENPEAVKTNDSIINKLKNTIEEWKDDAASQIANDYPFNSNEEKLLFWQETGPSQQEFDAALLIDNFEQFCRDTKETFDRKFWEAQLGADSKKGLSEAKIAHRLLISEWQKRLHKAATDWKLNRLLELRQLYLSALSEWLKLVESLSESLSSLGLEPGIWLDLSTGVLSEREVEEFQRWSEYLAKDNGAQRVADLLGKMRQIDSSTRIERATQSIRVKTPVVDISSKEEIVGIRLGRDIEHALPAELALLADPATSILFDLKYLDSRLLCFEMQGETLTSHDELVEMGKEVREEDQLGPMILCVDTSGSMQGAPESIAKAMALFLASQAREQNRPCYLINFSTGIATFELTGSEGLASLITFLSQSFYGGTDVAPALRHSLDIMSNETYKNSDVLVLSDFIMEKLSTDILQGIEHQRESGNRFNSLVIGDCFMSKRSRTHFDREWVYNPRSSRIHELVNFRDSLSDNE